MNTHKSAKRAGILVCVLLAVLFVWAGRPAVTAPMDESACTRAMLAAARGQSPRSRERSSYARAAAGQPQILLDVQVAGLVAKHPDLKFLPQAVSTVVFAVDPAQTDLRPDSWQALQESGLTVGFPAGDERGMVLRRCILGAISYGLGGPDGEKSLALDYLAQLSAADRLVRGGTDCPVVLCLDTEVWMNTLEGPPREICIPREGTRSYAWGILATGNPAGADPDALLAAGLRLPDGRCKAETAPPPTAYQAATLVTDFAAFDRVTQDAVRDMRRQVWGERKYHSADGREHILTLVGAILLILLWLGTALQRSNRQDVRSWLLVISGQTVGWLLLTLFKYNAPEQALLIRLCWYGYYFFLMGLPATALYMALRVDQPAPHNRTIWAERLGGGLYLALLVLVFTNDWHQLVFCFDTQGDWNNQYTYGPGYYLVFVYAAGCFLLALGLLLAKSRKSPRSFSWLWPVGTAAVLLGFNVGYVLGVPLCRETKLALVFSLLSILFVESLLRVGLIPNNNGYRKLFASSPLAMQLLDQQGVTRLAAARATVLTPAQRSQIRAHPGRSLQRDENTLLRSCPIAGGCVVWQEDLTAINRLQQELRSSIQQTEKANALLQQEQRVKREKISAQLRRNLFDRLETEMQAQTDALSRLVESLPETTDRSTQIAWLPLLLCHIKRRCNLFFLVQENAPMSANELAMYLDELSEFAGYAQVQALVRCGLTAPVPVEWGTLCYDFYFHLLSWAVRESRATLIGQVEVQPGQGLAFRVLSSREIDWQALPPAFCAAAEAAGAVLHCRAVEDTQSICLTFPAEERGPQL